VTSDWTAALVIGVIGAGLWAWSKLWDRAHGFDLHVTEAFELIGCDTWSDEDGAA
jgi:hypothetical protein